MSSLFVRLAPSLASPQALGLRSIEQLFGELDTLPEGHRAQRLLATSELEIVRLPLPGTPERPGGPLTGAPCGAGTGALRVKRWRAASVGEAITARFSAPRSLSFAEREWNLLCHLRLHGVGAPEPLAVAREGVGPFVTRSLLVLREPEGVEPLPLVLERSRGLLRRRLASALGSFLARLFRAGVELERLELALLAVGRVREPGARVHLGAGERSLAFSALPEIVLVDAPPARLRDALGDEPRRALLARLAASLPGTSARERLAVALPALAEVERATRRALLQRGCGGEA